DIRLIFVPNPTTNLLAVGLFDVADMVRERSGANAPRKYQQAEANKLESDEDSHRPRNHTFTPIAMHLTPTRKNVERGEQHCLVKPVNNVVKLRSVPEAH